MPGVLGLSGSLYSLMVLAMVMRGCKRHVTLKHRPYKRAHSATVHSVTEHDQAVHSSAPVLAVRCKNRFKLAPQADFIWSFAAARCICPPDDPLADAIMIAWGWDVYENWM